MALGKQIRKYREHRGWTMEDLSKASGVPIGTIGALEVRDSTRSMYAQAIAAAFGVTVDTLLEVDPVGPWAHVIRSNVEPMQAPTRMIPLIAQVKAGMFKEIIDSGSAEMIATAAPLKRYTFALRVSGDSMLPTFPDGCIVYVDPEVEPQPGHYVIAENEAHEGTFKKLVRVDGQLWLQPLNPQYQAQPLRGKLVGKVTGYHYMFD